MSHDMKTCSVCDWPFERRNDVKRHLVEHLLSDAYGVAAEACTTGTTGLVCQICRQVLANASTYKCHMRNHAALPVYKCEICDKYFSDSSNFVKHKKLHNKNVFVCDMCKKKFQMKTSLIKHMETHTEPIKCKECKHKDVYFSSKWMYKKHYRRYHNDERYKYTCPICHMRFYLLKEKWNHMWVAHQVRNFQADCPICRKQFRLYSEVKKHMKYTHRLPLKNFEEFKNVYNTLCTNRDDVVLIVEQEENILNSETM